MKDESTALVPVTTMQTVQVIKAIAPVVAAARMFSVTQEQAAVVMLKGHELGFGIATAFEFIHMVEGKPSIAPKGMLALIHQSNDIELKVTRLPEDKSQPLVGYECWMKRKHSGFEHTSRFTLEDAKRADLVKSRGNWEKYPENMCMWRAIGFAADVVCPDLGGGMYRPEELGAMVDAEGEPIQAQVVTVTEQPAPEPAQFTPSTTQVSLQALTEKYGAQTILSTNNGRIPQTDQELAEIAAKLAEAANVSA